jgi:hypothetical protein
MPWNQYAMYAPDGDMGDEREDVDPDRYCTCGHRSAHHLDFTGRCLATATCHCRQFDLDED